jgi:16S rRNA (guanine(966)-N(2))-methyltransferase RsmD
VIAGSLKGRWVVVPNLGITRPPLTRLRRSLFDFLMPYLGEARYLDLFSGTGSYLFEAASRGAAKVLGVEKEPRLAEAINSAARGFSVDSVLRCQPRDVFAVIPELAARGDVFDIVTLAPPQYMGLIDKTLAALLAHPVTNSDSLVICQHDTSETRDIDFTAWRTMQQRVYGNTTFTVLRSKETTEQ